LLVLVSQRVADAALDIGRGLFWRPWTIPPKRRLPKFDRGCYTIDVTHPYTGYGKGGGTMFTTILTYVVFPVVADVLTHIICKWLDEEK
jgi:hypothetical protein